MSDMKYISKKIVLLGDPSVGKTSITRKFVFDIFSDRYILTLGTKITKKQLVYEKVFKDIDVNLTMLIWDVMGQHDMEKFHAVAFTGCKGAIIVCDITRDETVENLKYWQKNLFDSGGEIPIVIIGNKNDLAQENQSGVELFKKISTQFETPSFLTSAKTGENIEKAFYLVGESILKRDNPD